MKNITNPRPQPSGKKATKKSEAAASKINKAQRIYKDGRVR